MTIKSDDNVEMIENTSKSGNKDAACSNDKLNYQSTNCLQYHINLLFLAIGYNWYILSYL